MGAKAKAGAATGAGTGFFSAFFVAAGFGFGFGFLAGFFLPACGWNFEGGFARCSNTSHAQMSLTPASEDFDSWICQSAPPASGGFARCRGGVSIASPYPRASSPCTRAS
ncbi:MAG: hypothetical protein WDO69_23845 [Pseudomonadota bacterium]